LNPRPPDYELYGASLPNYSNLRSLFIKWLYNKASKRYAKDIIRTLDKHAPQIRNVTDYLAIFNETNSQKLLIVSLRNYISFLEEYSYISDTFALKLRKPLVTLLLVFSGIRINEAYSLSLMVSQNLS
jgi:intergrase/recombinase